MGEKFVDDKYIREMNSFEVTQKWAIDISKLYLQCESPKEWYF